MNFNNFMIYKVHINYMHFLGLSKFAHLINVNFFGDLFDCLKNIIQEKSLSLEDSLNCISTVFTIVTGETH